MAPPRSLPFATLVPCANETSLRCRKFVARFSLVCCSPLSKSQLFPDSYGGKASDSPRTSFYLQPVAIVLFTGPLFHGN